MPRKIIKLTQNEHVKEVLDKAVDIAEQKKQADPKLANIRDLLQTREIKNILLDILETSSMTEVQKEYVRRVFVDREPPKSAIRKATHNPDLGRAEDYSIDAITKHPAVQDFIDVVKLFYVRIAPVAAVKELELILNPRTKDGVRIEAIKDIQTIAGVRQPEGQGNQQLPVRIIINMPGANPTQINEGEKNGQ